MRDTMIYARVGRKTPTTPRIVEEAGGLFKCLWTTEDRMLVMFEDAAQKPPRSSLTVDYSEMHKSGNPAQFIRRHILESRKKFKEATNGK